VKELKKLGCFVIAICLSSQIFVYAENREYTEENLIISKALLNDAKVNIWDIDTEGLDQRITRAQVTAVIVRMLNILEEEMEDSHKTAYFNDISKDYWAVREIGVAFEKGIIQGDGNGMFRPNDYCTYAEAVKMVITCLGWGVKAQYVYGGYPKGYFSMAEELNLFPIKLKYEEIDIKDSLMVFIYNALNVPTLEKVWLKSTDTYEESDNILTRYHGISKEVGFAKRISEKVFLINEIQYEVEEVISDFEENYVLCLYEENNKNKKRKVILYLLVSGLNFDKRVEKHKGKHKEERAQGDRSMSSS
jgi:hypothetical protein